MPRWPPGATACARPTCAAAGRAPRDRVAVRYRPHAFDEPIEIAPRTPRTLDGAPSTVSVRYFSNFVGTVIVDRPPAYVVPPAVAEHLERHGLRTAPATGTREDEVATIIGQDTDGGRKILEASAVGHLEVAWKREARGLPAGARLVGTDGPLGAMAVYLCEPESDDGAVENGLVEAPVVGSEYPIWRTW